MENVEDYEDFDADMMLNMIKSTLSYDEFRVKCDINNIECIISQEEYDSLKLYMTVIAS